MDKTPVKVGMIISSLRTGGKERMTVAVLEHLDRACFDPFLCVMKEGELLESLQNQRVYSRLMRFRGDVFGFAWRLFNILRRENPQILICLSYRIPGWTGRIVGKLSGIPVVIFELHGVERVGERDLELPDRLIFRHLTDHMIAIGEDFRKNLIRDGVTPEQITVIRNGIDTDRFTPLHDKSMLKRQIFGFDAPVISNISSMRPKKNLPMLVDAFAIVLEKFPAARLVLIGDGSERENLEAYIAECGLRDKVLMTGKRQDVADLMRASDIIALSSTTEAAPLTILEAGACGVPVVSTAVGEIPDMIIDGETGFLVPSMDIKALAKRLCDLLGNDDLRAKMGAAAREYITANFSIKSSVRAREMLFIRLLTEKGVLSDFNEKDIRTVNHARS